MDYRKTTKEDLKREDYIASARIDKALLVADAIEHMITNDVMKPKDLVRTSHRTRSLAAQLAQELHKRQTGSDITVHVPSEISWALAVKIYRRRMKEQERQAIKNIATALNSFPFHPHIEKEERKSIS